MEMNPAILWLVALIIFVAIEIATVGLTTIWFAGGALVAEIAELMSAPFWLQVVLFFAVSIALLIFTRPLAMKYINKNQTKTNVDSLIGRQAVVTEDIDNIRGHGKALVQGMTWTARAKDDTLISANEIVNIEAVDGVKLIVTATGKREEK